MSEKNIQYERKLSNLEKLGVVQMDLMEIEQQLTALYGQKKAKQKEADVIWQQVLLESRNGKTIFDKEE